MNTGPVIGPVIGASALLVVVGLISVGAYRIGGGLSGIHGPAQGPALVSAVSVNGPALFGANCAGCHGAQAQGGVGPKLTGEVGHWSAPQFARAVREGQDPEGKALAPLMPHFRTAGFDGQPPTDAQLAAVQTVLKGLK